MLDANLKAQLKTYLERVSQPIEIVASLDDTPKSQETLGLLQDIDGLSDRITLVAVSYTHLTLPTILLV